MLFRQGTAAVNGLYSATETRRDAWVTLRAGPMCRGHGRGSGLGERKRVPSPQSHRAVVFL